MSATLRTKWLTLALACVFATPNVPLLQAQSAPVVVDDSGITLRMVDIELRLAVQMLAQYLDKPVLVGVAPGVLITLETPRPLSRAEIPALLRAVLETHGFDLVEDTTASMYRVRPRVPPRTGSARQLPSQTPDSVVSADSGGVRLYVLPIRHARAADVASTINALYGGGAPGSGAGSLGSSLSDQLRGNLDASLAAMHGGQRAVDAEVGTSSVGPMMIIADARTNSLLVRTDGATMTFIRNVVAALDKRPLQVLIEVLIAEVRHDKSIGVSVEGELAPTTVGENGATIEGGLGSPGLGDFAIRVMGIGGLDLEGTLRVAAGRGSVRVLTRPVLLATNNEAAEIVVGSQRPFVQVQRSMPTDAAVRDQVVQYKDVGTRLQVTPTISEDGTVQLDVMQEVSNATSELAFNAPVISTRTVRTQLLVRDGQTVAIGGLMDRQHEARSSGLPLLSAIPLIGGFFGRSSRQQIETELFVFLTPRVIRNDDEASQVSDPLRKRVGGTP